MEKKLKQYLTGQPIGLAAVLGALILALAAPASAFTTKTTNTGARIRWAEDQVSIQLQRDLVEMLDPGEAIQAAQIGTDAWRGLPRVPDLLLQNGLAKHPPGYHEGISSNGVYLLAEWAHAGKKLDKQKLAVTVTTYEENTGKLLDADVLVSGEVPYELLEEDEDVRGRARADEYDLAAVLTHEMGHVLGLGESDASPAVTMWPYIRRGESHQRTIEPDDEQGAVTVYRSPLPEASSGVGCGNASVPGRPAASGWMPWLFAAVLLLVLAGPLLRRRCRFRGAGLPGFAMAFAPLLLLPTPSPTADTSAQAARIRNIVPGTQNLLLLDRAARDDASEVRLAVAEVLSRHPHREHRELASRLAEDENPAVAQAGQTALAKVLWAPPLARVPAREASARLTRLLDPDLPALHGRVRRLQATLEQGLVTTRYELTDPESGRTHTFELPGGTVNGITQQVGEEPTPGDQQELVVVPRPDGRTAWAHVHAGALYGGSLGDGPAIEIEIQ